MVMLLLGWIACAALYALLAGQPSPEELAFAAVVGLGVSLWSRVLRRRAEVAFRFEPAALAAIARTLAGAPRAVALTAVRLASAALGGGGGWYEAQPFVEGPHEAPREAARRAVAVLLVSLTPDGFVLRAPQGRQTLETHLIARAGAPNPRWGR